MKVSSSVALLSTAPNWAARKRAARDRDQTYVLWAFVRIPLTSALAEAVVKLFSKYSNLCEKHTSTSLTDGRLTVA